MKFRFTAEHFVGSSYDPANLLQAVADRANALLEAEEAKCERVYELENCSDVYFPTCKRKNYGNAVKSALLWNVEKIGEEK